jgi:hypothetical protein
MKSWAISVLFFGDKKYSPPLPAFNATKAKAEQIVKDLFKQGLNGRAIAEIELNDGKRDYYFDQVKN